MAASYPWKDGNYKGEGFIEAIILTGNKAIPTAFPEMELTFELGDFGPAEKEVVEISGQKNNTVRITFVIADKERERLAVVMDEGKAFYFKSSMANVAVGKLEWMTAEEAAMVEGQGDPIDAPPSPHTVEPGRVGKLVWISGPPGLGKSTSAQLLARHHGYVYYEGDCFFGLKNPFIPPDVAQPTLAVFKQPKLLGEGLEARRSAVTKTMKELQAMWAGKEWEQEGLEEGYKHLFADIARQRARIGGDWAVATILHSRQLRDLVRCGLAVNCWQ